MMERSANDNSFVISYWTLRKIIGVLGLGLPFVLAIGAPILGARGIQESMSGYYHTRMGDVFVGVMCVIGFFLLSYRGNDERDDRAGNVACLCAVGLALFPTAPAGAVGAQKTIGYVHFAFAALFFLTLIYYSLFLFTQTKAGATPSPQKINRNRVYRACGWTMLGCLVGVAIYKLALVDSLPLARLRPVFWLESLAVVAFGFSWITKGEAILADK